METVEARLSRLERSAWRWRAACLGLVALLFVGAKAAPQDAEFKNVFAQSLAVMSPEGKPVFIAGIGDDGRPYTSLQHPDGKPGETIRSIVGGGKALIGLGQTDDGNPAAVMMWTEKSSASVMVGANAGKGAATLRIGPTGAGHFYSISPDGTSRAISQ